MARILDPTATIRSFLREFLYSQLVHGRLSADEYQDRLGLLERDPSVAETSELLFRESPNPVSFGRFGPLRIIHLQEPNGKSFPFLHGLTKASKQKRKPITCFVGHRFLPGIERALRFNLSHLLEPLGVRLRWANQNLSAKDLFASIVEEIRAADMCIFDNYGTTNRPNVYIEIGIAYALSKPTIFCDHRPKRKAATWTKAEEVPSDLSGLFRLQYDSYQSLARSLYFSLPTFLNEHHLRPPAGA